MVLGQQELLFDLKTLPQGRTSALVNHPPLMYLSQFALFLRLYTVHQLCALHSALYTLCGICVEDNNVPNVTRI